MEIIISIVFIAIIFTIGMRETIKLIRNPKPLLENGDKRFIEVKKEKTRSILNIEAR